MCSHTVVYPHLSTHGRKSDRQRGPLLAVPVGLVRFAEDHANHLGHGHGRTHLPPDGQCSERLEGSRLPNETLKCERHTHVVFGGGDLVELAVEVQGRLVAVVDAHLPTVFQVPLVAEQDHGRRACTTECHQSF